MTKQSRFGRWFLLLSLVAGAGTSGLMPVQAAKPDAVASADQLKSKAFEALRAGKFDQTNSYLSQAAELVKDPLLVRMATWTKQFEEQRQVFLGERRKEYEKAVADVKLLLAKHKESFAVEVAARAHLLADDKEAFRKEPWVAALLADAKKRAEDYEKNEQWIKSLKIYSQLSAIEPESPQWKERLKTSTRRVRLLAMYTPDDLKQIQEAEAKEREEVDAILNPTTRPATKPASAEDEEETQNRMKWQDTLKGVRMEMLRDALLRACDNYWRPVTYKATLVSGLNSLRVVLTTPSLEKTFPGLKGAEKAKFLGFIDGRLAKLETSRDEASTVIELLRELQRVNQDSVQLPEEVLVSEFADGAFAALDPFSSIIWPNDWEEFQKTTKGEFSGVGIQIQIDESGNLKVVSPLEDSPAYRAGIKPDWIITHIDGRKARWISLNQAVKQITGPPGTEVVLTIRDTKNVTKDYRLKRDTIKVASVKGWLHRPGGGWDYLIDSEQKIGYVRLTNFAKTTDKDLEGAIEQMRKQGVRGMILDLRYNPGGLLNAATEITDRFISEGVIVKTRPDRPDSGQESVTTARRTYDEVKLPLIVLINQYSASASEIVSGALKDHKRAVIVGERTFGKGSVQMLYPLGSKQPPESVLKLTTSHYYLPNGKCIHREENSKEWGVEPNVTIEMTPEQMRAAIDARQEFDVLRDLAPAEGAAVEKKAAKAEDAVAKVKKDPLGADPQLAAGLLLMRLQLSGAPL